MGVMLYFEFVFILEFFTSLSVLEFRQKVADMTVKDHTVLVWSWPDLVSALCMHLARFLNIMFRGL